MNKKILIITLVVVLFIVCGGLIAFAEASGALDGLFSGAPKVSEPEELTLAERFEKYATDEQKKALEDSETYDFLGWKYWYERRIRIILGEIPEDSPRITLEQAREICEHFSKIEENDVDKRNAELVAAFSEYAVPDYDGGSGFRSTFYFLDDEPTGYILIRWDSVTYYDLVNGTKEVLL